ncbi:MULTISPECIES: SHOCT domain-containing protein [Cohaesibacter]|uniref:SHOCT domain-containing protein n=1 Tax=Cohaesibacter TaxID=655352 RepID=UPI0010FD4424|nr:MULTISPECIES: SHOCT domain-containing protein [Cohaesibacter]TLP47203.1 SHOCT domain-containing protein [Cohaesibacter sp. CAU 1516]
MILVVLWLLFALIPGFVASGKGNSFILYFLVSLVLSPIVGLIIALIVPGKTATSPGIQFVAPAKTDVADELRKLSDLHKEGIISEAEFSRKKTELIGSAPG